MIPNDLLDVLADALDEDIEELKKGTARRVPECTKRQAFLLVLHRAKGHSIGQLADWLGKGFSTVHGIVTTAQDYYDCADPFFLKHYQAAEHAFETWLQTQPEEV